MFATNGAGVKVWEASFLPFGGVHVTTGATFDLRFPGQWFQSESGLHQNWMRDYDPTTGRYIQADPLGLVDGASVYGYARQNLGRYIDPTGELIPALIGGAVANVVIGFYIDKYFGDDCYTLNELAYDLTLGAAFGGLGKAWGLAGTGWRYGAGAGIASKVGSGSTKGITNRPSGFRKKTVQNAWDNAATGTRPSSKACPTCGKDVKVAPRQGRRDWDVDHQPKWKDRDLTGMDRPQVLDEFNRDVRLRCPSCNRADN